MDGLLIVDTNIVIFDLIGDAPEAARVVAAMQERDIRVGALGKRRMRMVTHLDVNAEDAELALRELGKVLAA